MKQKKEILILFALLVVAGGVWYWQGRPPAVTAGTASVVQNFAPLKVENPALHWWKRDASRKTEYKSSGRDLFSEVQPPPPEAPKHVPKPGDKDYVAPGPQPPPPPQLPPNLKYFGYGTVPVGTGRLAFFTDGTDVFIVGEGDILLGRYRILKIGNANLEFEEVGSGRRGSTTLEDAGAFG